jgi:hypothetical protein
MTSFTDLYITSFTKAAGLVQPPVVSKMIPSATKGSKASIGGVKLPEPSKPPALPKASTPKVASFTDFYLVNLQHGMAKQATIMDSIKNFAPLAGENAGITGTALGAAGGAVVGGLSNALLGSSSRDPRTGEKTNGVMARLMKGGLVGAGLGGAAGYAGRDSITGFGRDFMEGKVRGSGMVPEGLQRLSSAAGSENATLGDLYNYTQGGTGGVLKGRVEGIPGGAAALGAGGALLDKGKEMLRDDAEGAVDAATAKGQGILNNLNLGQ